MLFSSDKYTFFITQVLYMYSFSMVIYSKIYKSSFNDSYITLFTFFIITQLHFCLFLAPWFNVQGVHIKETITADEKPITTNLQIIYWILLVLLVGIFLNDSLKIENGLPTQ